MNFGDPKVLTTNNNVRPRKLLEAFYSQNNQNSINRSVEYPDIYK